MFICGFCKQLSREGEPEKLVVTEWRKKEYPSVELPKKFGDTRRRFSRSGVGFEFVRVERACGECVASGRAKGQPQPVVERVQSIPMGEHAKFPGRVERSYPPRHDARRSAPSIVSAGRVS